MTELLRDQICLIAEKVVLTLDKKNTWEQTDGVYSTQVAFVPSNCIVKQCAIKPIKSSGETLSVKIGTKTLINNKQVTETETSSEIEITSRESIVSLEADMMANGEYLVLVEFYFPTLRELSTK